MYIHDKGFGFKSIAVANNHDLTEEELVSYIIALPNQPMVSAHFEPERTVYPLDDLKKNHQLLKNLE